MEFSEQEITSTVSAHIGANRVNTLRARLPRAIDQVKERIKLLEDRKWVIVLTLHLETQLELTRKQGLLTEMMGVEAEITELECAMKAFQDARGSLPPRELPNIPVKVEF